MPSSTPPSSSSFRLPPPGRRPRPSSYSQNNNIKEGEHSRKSSNHRRPLQQQQPQQQREEIHRFGRSIDEVITVRVSDTTTIETTLVSSSSITLPTNKEQKQQKLVITTSRLDGSIVATLNIDHHRQQKRTEETASHHHQFTCEQQQQQHVQLEQQQQEIMAPNAQSIVPLPLLVEEEEQEAPVVTRRLVPKTKRYNDDGIIPSIPPNVPTSWPQAPLLLRATPQSGMTIRGVRFSSSSDYFFQAEEEETGAGAALPINTGMESRGQCLVIDFETPLFEGTAMLRIRDAPSHHGGKKFGGSGGTSGNNSNNNYFTNRRRRFQAVIRGQFRKPGIPMNQCITGQMFNRPGGQKHLPSKFFLHSAVKCISVLSPQLQAQFDGPKPRFLSPLVPTAQTVICSSDQDSDVDVDGGGAYQYYKAGMSIEEDMYEPNDSTSILESLPDNNHHHATNNLKSSSSSSMSGVMTSPFTRRLKSQGSNDSSNTSSSASEQSRLIKQRKTAFNKLYKSGSYAPTFRTDAVYTFEFFQHLLYFEDMSLELLGTRHELAGMLAGQPLKFMAAQQQTGKNDDFASLWNFEIWHESLYKQAMMNADQ